MKQNIYYKLYVIYICSTYLFSASFNNSPFLNTIDPWTDSGGPQDPRSPDKRSMVPNSLFFKISAPVMNNPPSIEINL